MTTLTLYSNVDNAQKEVCSFSGMASITKVVKVDGGPFLQKTIMEKRVPHTQQSYLPPFFFTGHFFLSSFSPVLWVR